MKLSKVFDELLLAKLSDKNEFEGYSLDKIKSYETQLNIRFPEVYRNFLQLCGFSGFSPFYSFSYRLEGLSVNKEWLQKLRGFDSDRPYCVFLCDFSGGYKYFYCDENEDPRVFSTDDLRFDYCTDFTFSEYLLEEIRRLSR